MIAANPSNPAPDATLVSAAYALPRASLTVINAGGSQLPQGPVFLDQFPFVIGRIEGALVIPNPNISRRHAEISFDDANRSFWISDLRSSNGTRLNNQAVLPDQPARLASGSILTLGPNIVLRFDIL